MIYGMKESNKEKMDRIRGIKLVKGSQEAKDYMERLRGKRKKGRCYPKRDVELKV